MLEPTSEVLRNYKHREPEETVLYHAIRDNLPAFLAESERRLEKPLPVFVKKELEAFLECGVKKYIGYSKWQCDGCQTTMEVAHSCKCRGFCPSCGGRRMCQCAANIVDHVLPKEKVRQWVVSLPFELRYWVAADSALLDEINIIIHKTIGKFYETRAELQGADNPQFGAVSFIQRSGGSINLNPHYHCMFLEGSFDHGIKGVRGPRFFEAGPVTDEDVFMVATRISERVLKLLIKRGLIKEEEDFCHEEVKDHEDPMQALRQSSLRGYVICGERSGQEVRRTGRSFGKVGQEPKLEGRRCVSINGFSIHANSSVRKHQMQEKERLLRYMARPPLSLDRLSTTESGNYVWHLKTEYSNGTSALEFSGIELTEKIASIIPPPWKNLTRYFGCLAPNAKIRGEIVPRPTKQWDAKLHNYWIPWAQLLRRVFQIDILKCSECGGRLCFVEAIGPTELIRPPPDSFDAIPYLKTEEPAYSTGDIDFP